MPFGAIANVSISEKTFSSLVTKRLSSALPQIKASYPFCLVGNIVHAYHDQKSVQNRKPSNTSIISSPNRSKRGRMMLVSQVLSVCNPYDEINSGAL